MEHVLTRARGNPPFLEELANQILDATAPSGEISLPGTMSEVLRERIHALRPTTRELLDVAAVLGVEYPRPLWQAVWGRPLPEGELAVLQRLDLIRQNDAEGDLFAFRHELIQETA